MRHYNRETDGRGRRDGHHTRLNVAKDKARRYAERWGHEATSGGYIKTCTGLVICQGWLEYYRLLEQPIERFNGGGA